MEGGEWILRVVGGRCEELLGVEGDDLVRMDVLSGGPVAGLVLAGQLKLTARWTLLLWCRSAVEAILRPGTATVQVRRRFTAPVVY